MLDNNRQVAKMLLIIALKFNSAVLIKIFSSGMMYKGSH